MDGCTAFKKNQGTRYKAQGRIKAQGTRSKSYKRFKNIIDYRTRFDTRHKELARC